MLLALGGTAAFGPVQAAPKETDRQRLIEAVTVPGIQEHLRAFARFAAKNGGNRASTTVGYGSSAHYVATRLREAGYRVHIQPFDYLCFEETAPPTLARVAPSPQSFAAGTDFLTMSYSGSGAVT